MCVPNIMANHPIVDISLNTTKVNLMVTLQEKKLEKVTKVG